MERVSHVCTSSWHSSTTIYSQNSPQALSVSPADIQRTERQKVRARFLVSEKQASMFYGSPQS